MKILVQGMEKQRISVEEALCFIFSSFSLSFTCCFSSLKKERKFVCACVLCQLCESESLSFYVPVWLLLLFGWLLFSVTFNCWEENKDITIKTQQAHNSTLVCFLSRSLTRLYAPYINTTNISLPWFVYWHNWSASLSLSKMWELEREKW